MASRETRVTEVDESFEALLTYLKETRGFDFTGYKRTSLRRRVDRRLGEIGLESYDDYVDTLEVHPEEFTTLFNSILINVTDFFRDRDSWDELRAEIVPHLLQLRPSEPVRVWSAGCASGQEAYSAAILLADVLGVEEFRDRVKVYATDIDEEALTQARHGIYSEREMTGLTPEQVEKWFEPGQGGRYAFRRDLRRAVIFGRNDLVQDAPISRIDLLLCRNTLMYFNAETQDRILQRLHFALKPGGVLFLGRAEMLLSHTALFAPLDLKRRFFGKAVSATDTDRSLNLVGGGRPYLDDVRRPALEGQDDLREAAWATGAVAQVVVDAEGRLALANTRADALFGLSPRDLGRPFQDLELSYRPVELRGYLEQARDERRPVWIKDVELVRAGTDRLRLEVQVVPLYRGGTDWLGSAVVFNDVSRYYELNEELLYANRQLETAYEELQSTNEELETTNEELQSTVEELETTNEELQSTNEELETMNEELQSMNDELQGTNEALRGRTSEVAQLNGFLQAILTSLRGCVIVLDSDWRVRIWNRPAEQMWGLRSEEVVGQHVLNLDIGLPVDALKPALRDVLQAREADARRRDGQAAAETGVAAPAAPGLDAVDGTREPLLLDAVNRRGRAVRVRASVSPLVAGDSAPAGAIVLVEAVDEQPA